MPNYVIIEGIRCPICGAQEVHEIATWRMGSQNVRQLVCIHGHNFRAYEPRLGVYKIVTYKKKSVTESTITVNTEENGRWQFAPAPTISLEELKNFMAHLKAGLELELDYKLVPNVNANVQIDEIDRKTREFFKLPITRYHEVPSCPVCGLSGCWQHIPPKRVRAIEKDGSIIGNESLVYGSGEPSEEFAEHLKPTIEFFSQYYQVTERDSCHVHLLVTDDYLTVPITVANNFWQLMRYYYPGYAWVFGNTPGTFLRKSGYSGFQDLLVSPLFDNVGVHRNAIYFGESYIQNRRIIIFNIENRLADSSLNIKQLVALRAVNLALMKRAAELSLVGLIKVDNDKWPIYKGLGQIINDLVWRNLSPQQVDMELVKKYMKQNAEEMLDEIKHLLTDFEYNIIKELIENPPRESNQITTTDIRVPANRVDSALLKTIISIPPTKTEEESISLIAKALGKPEKTIKKELEKLGFTWVNGKFTVVK